MPAYTSVSTPSGNLLQTLLDVSLSGVILLRPVYDSQDPTTIWDFSYDYLNPAALRLLHLPACPAESLLTLFPQASDNGVFSFYCETFLSGQPGAYDVPDLPKYSSFAFRLAAWACDEQLVVSFMEMRNLASPAAESLLHLVGQTDAEVARADAERQRERLHQVLVHLPASVAILHGPDLVYTLVNPGYQQLFSFGRELHGRPLREALPELVGQPILKALEQVYHTGESYQATEAETWVDFSGTGQLELAYFNVMFQPVRDQAGQVSGIINFAYNVTEAVVARQQLQELNLTLEARVHERTERLHLALEEAEQHRKQISLQQNLLQQILAQVPAAVATFTGPDHRYVYFNHTYQERSGGRSRVGQPLAEMFPELERQGFVALLDQVYATGQPYQEIEGPAELIDAQTGASSLHYVDLLYQPLQTPDGQTTGIVAFIVDVTDKVRARQLIEQGEQQARTQAEEFRRNNEQLTRLNADLDNFIYAASHDLKTPINNIVGLLEALREQLPTEAHSAPLVPELLTMLEDAAARFQLTIAQLADVTHLQQRNAQSVEAVDLAALVESVRLDLAPQIAAAQATLTINVSSCAHVLFPPQHLRSIIYNLLSNAIKYRSPNRPALVQVRCEGIGGITQLQVQDNGLGLTEVQQEKLFGMFQRLHTHVEGSGVGLFMVKRILDNAGGSIHVESQPGEGTTFSISLPRSKPERILT